MRKSIAKVLSSALAASAQSKLGPGGGRQRSEDIPNFVDSEDPLRARAVVALVRMVGGTRNTSACTRCIGSEGVSESAI